MGGGQQVAVRKVLASHRDARCEAGDVPVGRWGFEI